MFEPSSDNRVVTRYMGSGITPLGSGITVTGSGITSHGIRISNFSGHQGSNSDSSLKEKFETSHTSSGNLNLTSFREFYFLSFFLPVMQSIHFIASRSLVSTLRAESPSIFLEKSSKIEGASARRVSSLPRRRSFGSSRNLSSITGEEKLRDEAKRTSA